VKDDLRRVVKILQTERLTKDIGDSLRVFFRKEQGMAPQTVNTSQFVLGVNRRSFVKRFPSKLRNFLYL